MSGVALQRLWLIGCGNMAGAMLSRWIDSGRIAAGAVDVVNRNDRALPGGVRQARTLPDGPPPDAIMLGMKPQQIDEIVAQYGDAIARAPMLISILAGVEEATLAERFPGPAIVRAMPNLPVALGKGVVVLHARAAPPPVKESVAALMAPLGLVEWTDDEASYGALGTLEGCGPAFLFRFIDALAKGGEALGIPGDQAARLALATVEGAAAMATGADATPATLADRVASPGGSTREGLNVLDRDEALVMLLTETLAAARKRGEEMAAEARR
ncbi:MAG: pyrroline-5-carboxylate reductase [Sphingomonas sp.]|uniref:pyrroline-5-carboxylate reductase family protein n=1 Tax=Sphingomonas sp. TaxID=28214 RepID=UPI001212D344|nr:pyrroline-5-carboxylate reductase dimerization domain-containing protein [Sphingomonas sp.]THD37242.1 MAG: pyrroline-5-carboxylate reductase [Sphingomonas sp.]